MSTVVSNVIGRDHIGEFILLLESTNGRDKVCRIIQYMSKLMKYIHEVRLARLESESIVSSGVGVASTLVTSLGTPSLTADRTKALAIQADKVKMWDTLMTTMAMVRRVLRLWRSLSVMRGLRAAIPSDLSTVDSVMFFNLLARFCLFNYFFWDGLVFSLKIGSLKLLPRNAALVNTVAEGAWLGEICCTLTENVIRLGRLTSADASPKTDLARNAAIRAIFRNLFDLPTCMHFMQIGPFWQAPHGIYGAAGVGSSAISLYEMWPTVNVIAGAIVKK